MAANALMFQGTGSDVGKSLLVAGFCRALHQRGLNVAPFKPQNMSNNAAVAADSTEIGRAQAVQARAAAITPTADMNPVLLKPQSDIGAQVIVQGRVLGNYDAPAYQSLKAALLPQVIESFERLRNGTDIVLVEGAGSASEVNLRDGDIANMGFAMTAKVPVILIGDIDRGGVIASIFGTQALLGEDEAALLKGYIINKFRGDAGLFDSGIEILAERTGLRCFGVVPWLDEARSLPAEDSVGLTETATPSGGNSIKIAVPQVRHISNFDDFDPLVAEPDVDLVMVSPGAPLPGDADLVILPGTKATVAALKHFMAQGWDTDLKGHLRRGGAILGICGGYQMLGRSVADPDGCEGPPGNVEGLNFLDIDTVIRAPKTLEELSGSASDGSGTVQGYRMHMGRTTGPDTERSFLTLQDKPDGAVSADRQVSGCYLHGLFAADQFRHAFLGRFNARTTVLENFEVHLEQALDAIAGQLEENVDIDGLLEIASQ